LISRIGHLIILKLLLRLFTSVTSHLISLMLKSWELSLVLLILFIELLIIHIQFGLVNNIFFER